MKKILKYKEIITTVIFFITIIEFWVFLKDWFLLMSYWLSQYLLTISMNIVNNAEVFDDFIRFSLVCKNNVNIYRMLGAIFFVFLNYWICLRLDEEERIISQKEEKEMYINTNLKYLRKKENMSYRELMVVSGVPHTVIERIEKQQTKNPSIETVIKLCSIFNVCIDDFIYKDLSKDNIYTVSM